MPFDSAPDRRIGAQQQRRLALACVLFALVPLVGGSGGCSNLTCGPGTEQKIDLVTGQTICAAPTSTGVPCDADGGARLVGGVCQGDPSQYPTCGTGTQLNLVTHACEAVITDGGSGDGGAITPPSCPPPDATHFCINGVVRWLKDLSDTRGRTFEVRAYDPIAFLVDSTTKPQKTVTTDANGTYVLSGLVDPGAHLIAIGVTDVGGPTDFVISGAGQNMLAGGQTYRVDVLVVEKTTVAAWETQAGVAPMTFLNAGVYVARFLDKPVAMEDQALPVAGVQLTTNGNMLPASELFYLSGTLATIDPTLHMTDAATGAALHLITKIGLEVYSGVGGSIGGTTPKWEAFPGSSAKGVVFVQKFHPTM